MIVDNQVRSSFRTAGENVRCVGRAAAAGAAGVGLMAGNLAHTVKDHAVDLKNNTLTSKGDVVTMKKSTLIALLVAIAAIAGVLVALYFYVLRREKELDEYEQLLFSEDFSDDLPDAFADDEKD